MPRLEPLVLVVDDDPTLRDTLTRELAAAGYATLGAADGIEGEERHAVERPDLVITDLAMPRADGLALIRAIRQESRTPILVLSVRGGEEDKVRALDAGADDFVAKPFSLRELLARVRAQLRRAQPERTQGELTFPGLVIDRERRQVRRDGEVVHLTPTELAILELLASRAGRPVTLRQIIGAVWQGAPATSNDVVRVHVGSLRRKLEPDPGRPRYIGTEPWVGYRFLVEPEEPGA